MREWQLHVCVITQLSPAPHPLPRFTTCMPSPPRPDGRLTRLDLAGCHRHVTGECLLGTLRGLRSLRHLDLACMDAVAEGELEALLPQLSAVRVLNLSDCHVGDRACALLASHAPQLEWLGLEHCPRVTDTGLRSLAGALPLLCTLRLCGSGVTAAAAARLQQRPRGRRLRISLRKGCWWMPPQRSEPGAAATTPRALES